MVKIVASIYSGPNKKGDFAWMIKQYRYRNYLFIYNDNEEAFLSRSARAGGGNAVIRPYSTLDPPRAAGIPTGFITTNSGYQKLTSRVKKIIDLAISQIRKILQNNQHLTHVVYSAANKDGSLGTGIFKVGEDVKEYIVEQIYQL